MDIDVKTADEYFKTRLGADSWFALDDAAKNSALVTAQNIIGKLPFIGVKADQNQETIFPRIYHGKRISMPVDVMYGIFEEAYSLILKTDIDVADVPDGVQSVSLGAASVTFKDVAGISVSRNSIKFLTGWLKVGFDIENCRYREVY